MLETARLDLVKFEMERDLAPLHAMFSDPEWARGGYMTPTATESESRDRLEREFGDNGGWTWVLRVRPEETAVGVIAVFSDQGSSIRGLSWYLQRDRWGAGRQRSRSTSAYTSILCTTRRSRPALSSRRRRRTCRGTGVRSRWPCRRDTG